VSRDVSEKLFDLIGTSPKNVVLPDSGSVCGFSALVLVSQDVPVARGDLIGPSPRLTVLANWGPFCEVLLTFWCPWTSPGHGVIYGNVPNTRGFADSGPICGFLAHVLVSQDVSEARGDLKGPSPRVTVLANWGPFCEVLLTLWCPGTSPDTG
jgi:hypothetical protein